MRQEIGIMGSEFSFIKATEGSSHVDPRFQYNWEQAQGTELEIGAYHFFSFDSPAETQLANFTAQVTAFDGMLPPVVDFEFYADKKVNPPDAEPLREQLRTFLNGLEGYSGEEEYIDLNVFCGSEEQWKSWVNESTQSK